MVLRHFQKCLSLVFGLFVLAFFSISCTRAVEKRTDIQLQLPSNMGKIGSMTTTGNILRHVVINVSGAGIANPIVYSWDSDDGRNPTPSAFTLNVPSGADRLVQVLALYGVEGQAGELFTYGDAKIAIQSDTMVTVKVEPIAENVSSSQILGRWVDGSISTDVYGPTTQVIMRYRPPGGKPPMYVHAAEMFGGLISLFVLDGPAGAGFEYVTTEGLNLFADVTATGTGTTTNNWTSGHFGTYLAKVVVPEHWRSRHGGSEFEVIGSSTSIIGFFGPAAIGHAVCVPNSGGFINDAYEVGGSIQLSWSPSWLTNGGAASSLDSGGLCTQSGVRFVDYLSFDGFMSSGREDAMAFRGPYVMKKDGSGWPHGLEATLSGNTMTLMWQYAPQTVTLPSHPSGRRGVDGSDAFYRILADPEDDPRDFRSHGVDGIMCSELSRLGFSPLLSKAADYENLNENVVTSVSPAVAAAYNEGRLQIILCPYQIKEGTKKYFYAGLEHRVWGNGGGMPLAEKFEIVPFINSGTVSWANNYCTQFILRGLTNNNQPARLPENLQTIVISTSDPNTGIYSGSLCYDLWSGSYVEWRGDGVLLSALRAGSGAVNVTVNVSAPGVAPLTTNFAFADPFVSSVESVWVAGPSEMKAHQCYAVQPFTVREEMGVRQILPLASGNYDFEFPNVPNLSYYYDANCTSSAGIPSLSFNSGGMMMGSVYYVKYTGFAASEVIPTLTPQSPTFLGGYEGPTNIVVTQPGPAVRLAIRAPHVQLAHSCNLVTLALEDSQGYYSPLGTTLTGNITLSGVDGYIKEPYMGTSCSCSEPTGPSTYSFSIPAGSSTVNICYKGTSLGSGALTVATSTLNNSVPVTIVEPPIQSFLVAAGPGESFNDGDVVVSGSQNVTIGVPQSFHIYAVYYDGNGFRIATQFNQSVTLTTTGLPGVPTQIDFINGVAVLTSTPTGPVSITIASPVSLNWSKPAP